MNRFLDKVVDALLAILSGKDKVNSSMATFLNKGKNGVLILSILFFIPFLLISIFLYNGIDNKWWSFIPIVLFFVISLIVAIAVRMDKRFDRKIPKSKREITGFNLDLNDLAFKKLYGYLSKYEYVNESMTSYQDFYDVMALNFDDNHSTIHFNMNMNELKYLLEHFKKLGNGITLTTFERSNKIFNKGKLISQRNLTSAYSEKIPDEEFRDHLDHFFKLLPDI